MANGLAFALDEVADKVKGLLVWDDILKAGGDPRTLRERRGTPVDG